MTKRYSTCQTVGELREALSGIPDDVALFGNVEEDRYVSVTVDLDKVAGNAVCLEPGPLVAEVMDRLIDASGAYCNGYEAARRNIPENEAVADARRSYGEALAEHFQLGYAEYRNKAIDGKA
jgi:hypothetical protein